MTQGKLGVRLTALAAIIVFFFAALVTRLWFLQVLAAEEYQARAQDNRVRLVPLPAPRGRILDRNGELLIRNRPSIVITVDRRRVDNQEALLFELAKLLQVPVKRLTDRLDDEDYLPFQPVPIYEDTPKSVALYIGEHREEFPGVAYQTIGVRDYVYDDLAPHALGYLGEISPEELEDPSFADVRPGQLVGRGGVEQHYERFLRGEDGWLKLEVDAGDRVLGALGRREAKPGNDLVLSLDRRIQELAQDTMREAVESARGSVLTDEGTYVNATAGAVVVLDPNTGHVLAMASYPTYDPRVFLGGFTNREFAQLKRPERNFPLNNRAIAGLYPPASAFKPFIASAAIKAGYAAPGGFYPCPPEFTVPGDTSGTVFRNWTTANLGSLSLGESLVRSCDTVYYQFGLDFYTERRARGEFLQQQLRRWGFGHSTGIDIPGEASGRVPDERWKRQVHEQYPKLFPEEIWLPGDNINMSVGQGDMLVTPLQMAVAYGAIANGGTLYRPQLGLKVVRPDGKVVERIEREPIGRVSASRGTLQFLRDSLRGVVSSPGGTATTAFSGFPFSSFPVSGKTGTAEVDTPDGEVLHSWFAGMAPADHPRYVVVALVEEGGHGAEVAAPIVRRVLEGLLGLEPAEFRIGSATD